MPRYRGAGVKIDRLLSLQDRIHEDVSDQSATVSAPLLLRPAWSPACRIFPDVFPVLLEDRHTVACAHAFPRRRCSVWKDILAKTEFAPSGSMCSSSFVGCPGRLRPGRGLSSALSWPWH